jgi:hypothetical protein
MFNMNIGRNVFLCHVEVSFCTTDETKRNDKIGRGIKILSLILMDDEMQCNERRSVLVFTLEPERENATKQDLWGSIWGISFNGREVQSGER